MTIDEFFKTYNGKKIDYDGVYKNQCVDLIKLYIDKVLGLTPQSVGDAKDYYNDYNKYSFLKNNFTRIANTLDFVPLKGDICIFGNGKYGHICIATGEGNTSYFYSYDQNKGGNLEPIQKVWHNYNYFLGVLRSKKNNNSKVVINCDILRVRKEPTTKSDIVTRVKRNEVYTIIEQKENAGYLWGRLKSGAGWIALNYTRSL